MKRIVVALMTVAACAVTRGGAFRIAGGGTIMVFR